MTRGVVPLLAERNVSGITVGENGGFCAPNVPYPLFRWEVGGASVVTAYHPGGYPDMCLPLPPIRIPTAQKKRGDQSPQRRENGATNPDLKPLDLSTNLSRSRYSCPHANMLYCTEANAGTLARRDCLLSGDQAFCFAFRTDNTGPPGE